MRGMHRLTAVAALAAAALTSTARADNKFRVTPLVSDGSVPGTQTDANLVNGWGIAFNPMGFVWVADNGTGKSTLYDGNGTPQSLVVEIPGEGSPTGIVFSGAADLVIGNGTTSAPARFIFATEDGIIAAWAPQVDMTHALAIPGAPFGDAIYKGLAIATTSSGSRLFATDFHNARVDAFDGSFQPLTTPGGFSDPHIPAHFAPFGIQTIGDTVYVTYALQDEDREEEVPGPGLGFVDAFDTDGRFLARVASRGTLNAPWGIAKAPDDFGHHGGDLIIGNFGDGRISTFEPRHRGHGRDRQLRWRFDGLLRTQHGPVQIDGLWGIAFGNGLNNQPRNALFFAAGPDDETHGVYGKIEAVNHH